MSNFRVYICPKCQKEVTVDASTDHPKVICGNCWEEFDAATATLKREEERTKVPFFKFSRRKVLAQKLEALAADGELSQEDKLELVKAADELSLTSSDLERIQSRLGQEEAEAVFSRIKSTFYVTDEDIQEMEAICHKYGLDKVEWDAACQLARKIYLIEAKGELIPPVQDTGRLMLNHGESLYFSLSSTWSQIRVKSKGYAGMSVSVPTGIKGVRIRLGQLSPIRPEELTPLSNGTLHVTSKRLLFDGNSRNTTVDYKRLVGISLFSDGIAVEKSTGKPDYFSMHPMNGRFISALVERLKQSG